MNYVFVMNILNKLKKPIKEKLRKYYSKKKKKKKKKKILNKII